MRCNISLFVVGLSIQPSKAGKAAMLIEDMDIAWLMIHVQKVEKDKLMDRQGFKNKRTNTSCNDFKKQKSSMNCSFQHKQKGPAPLSASALALRNKGEHNSQSSQPFRDKCAQSKGSEAKGGTTLLHVLGVVKPIQVFFVRAPGVV